MFPVVEDWDRVYDANTFLDNLPAYDTSFEMAQMLTLSREINQSGNYLWYGAAFPNIAQVPVYRVPALNTINGSINLPPGSYAVSINWYSEQVEGIKFKLYDKGTKASIFYGDYALASTVAGNMIPDTPDGLMGPGYLNSPFLITPPGVLNWELTNLSSSDSLIQMLVNCAVPINNQSLNTRDIKRG